jgi:ABC-type multidrug transport system fused ATPase/permease subunit
MWNELGKWLVRRTETRLNRILFVLAIVLLAAIFEAVLDTWLSRHAGGAWRLVLDAGSVGLLVGLITYIEIIAVQVRRERMEAELRTVSELNHNVRNALQAISYAVRLRETVNQVEIIEDCVRRIDATLRDLFPAHTLRGIKDDSEDTFRPFSQ